MKGGFGNMTKKERDNIVKTLKSAMVLRRELALTYETKYAPSIVYACDKGLRAKKIPEMRKYDRISAEYERMINNET